MTYSDSHLSSALPVVYQLNEWAVLRHDETFSGCKKFLSHQRHTALARLFKVSFHDGFQERFFLRNVNKSKDVKQNQVTTRNAYKQQSVFPRQDSLDGLVSIRKFDFIRWILT